MSSMHRALDVNLLKTFPQAVKDTWGGLRRLLQSKLKSLPGVERAVVGVVDDTLLIQATGGELDAISALAKKHAPSGMDIDLLYTEVTPALRLTQKKRL
jgi:hypothetical protein